MAAAATTATAAKRGKKSTTAIEPVRAEIPELSATLIPADVRARAETFTREATAIAAKEITSAAGLETADNLASGMKALETEIETNTKGLIRPVEEAVKSIKREIDGVLSPMVVARHDLAKRVVEAKPRLGIEDATSCYSQTRDKIQVKNLDKIPHTVKLPDGTVLQILKVDEAAVAKAIKAGVHVPGVYVDEQVVIGVRS